MGEFSALVTDPSAGGLHQLAAWKDARVVVGEGDEGEAGGVELESEGEEEEGRSDEDEGMEEGTRENEDIPSATDAGSLHLETAEHFTTVDSDHAHM